MLTDDHHSRVSITLIGEKVLTGLVSDSRCFPQSHQVFSRLHSLTGNLEVIMSCTHPNATASQVGLALGLVSHRSALTPRPPYARGLWGGCGGAAAPCVSEDYLQTQLCVTTACGIERPVLMSLAAQIPQLPRDRINAFVAREKRHESTCCRSLVLIPVYISGVVYSGGCRWVFKTLSVGYITPL